MIKVMIHNGERNSLVNEFPTAYLNLEEQLHSIGIRNPQGDIFPRDNEDKTINAFRQVSQHRSNPQTARLGLYRA